MKIALLVLLMTFSQTCFGQKSPAESFIGLHYSGIAYQPSEHRIRTLNPGFGATGHLGIGPHFGLEVAWETNFIRETHPTIDTVVHDFRTRLSSLRFCYSQTHDKWSVQAFCGVGFLLSPYEKLLPEIGLRGSLHLTSHMSLFAAVFGAMQFGLDPEFSGGHSPSPQLYHPRLDARFLFWGNAGVAFRGIVNQ